MYILRYFGAPVLAITILILLSVLLLVSLGESFEFPVLREEGIKLCKRDGGAGIVASIMSEVNSIVNDATGVIGGVVGDATRVCWDDRWRNCEWSQYEYGHRHGSHEQLNDIERTTGVSRDEP